MLRALAGMFSRYIRPMSQTSAPEERASRVLHALDHGTPKRRALRAIAMFEAVKGALALAACLGLLSLLHHDLHHLATVLISRVGLDPGAHYPTLLLHYADVVQDANLRTLVLGAAAYIAVRWAEAWGLWFGHSWGEWLGALSGAVYVPFEVRHLLHTPTFSSAAVLLLNLAVVAFLGWELWSERQRARGPMPPHS
jgi:uncharacterized membrane protein (DUF2068 family)